MVERTNQGQATSDWARVDLKDTISPDSPRCLQDLGRDAPHNPNSQTPNGGSDCKDIADADKNHGRRETGKDHAQSVPTSRKTKSPSRTLGALDPDSSSPSTPSITRASEQGRGGPGDNITGPDDKPRRTAARTTKIASKRSSVRVVRSSCTHKSDRGGSGGPFG